MPAEELQRIYDAIRSKADLQRAAFSAFLATLSPLERDTLRRKASDLGFTLSLPRGTLTYNPDFQPLKLLYDICYIRHGRTHGNAEPRTFQGRCDYPENQLDDVGRQQAHMVADQLDAQLTQWCPDLILSSPLQRAVDTAQAFAQRHPAIPFIIVPGCTEMAFGTWERMKIIDIDPEDPAHLFYIDQNVLVKAPGPHVVGTGWVREQSRETNVVPPESFLDVLERVKRVLSDLHDLPVLRARVTDSNQQHRPRILMYGHSVVGSAIAVLMGHGKRVPETGNVGFCGPYIMPHTTPLFLYPQRPDTVTMTPADIGLADCRSR